jgi:hypothetical protein
LSSNSDHGRHYVFDRGSFRLGREEFWRATTVKDGRLYFHRPDAPVNVYAVSIQPAGVIWADAEITRITGAT